MTRYDDVAAWLDKLAENKERDAHGETGGMFAATEANALREAARMLRENPDEVTAVDVTESAEDLGQD